MEIDLGHVSFGTVNQAQVEFQASRSCSRCLARVSGGGYCRFIRVS